MEKGHSTMKAVGPSGMLVEVHHRHLRVGVVGSLSEKCPRGQLVKSPTEHASARWCPATFRLPDTAGLPSRLGTKEPIRGEVAQAHTTTHTNQNKANTMQYNKNREQAEPTLLRAHPYSNRGNVRDQVKGGKFGKGWLVPWWPQAQTQWWGKKKWDSRSEGKGGLKGANSGGGVHRGRGSQTTLPIVASRVGPGKASGSLSQVTKGKGKGSLQGIPPGGGDHRGRWSGTTIPTAASPGLPRRFAGSWGGRGRGWDQRITPSVVAMVSPAAEPFCSSPLRSPPKVAWQPHHVAEGRGRPGQPNKAKGSGKW